MLRYITPPHHVPARAAAINPSILRPTTTDNTNVDTFLSTGSTVALRGGELGQLLALHGGNLGQIPRPASSSVAAAGSTIALRDGKLDKLVRSRSSSEVATRTA